MKKLIIMVLLLTGLLTGQVMNTARTLDRNYSTIQIYPSFPGEDIYLFLAGEYGWNSSTDFKINFGAGPIPYFRTNIEKTLVQKRYLISVTGGLQLHDGFGLHCNMNYTYPMSDMLDIYTGVEAEGYITINERYPIKYYLGNSISYKQDLKFFMEFGIGLYHSKNIISFGLTYNMGRF